MRQKDGTMVTCCGKKKTSHCALRLRAHEQHQRAHTVIRLYITLMASVPIADNAAKGMTGWLDSMVAFHPLLFG